MIGEGQHPCANENRMPDTAWTGDLCAVCMHPHPPFAARAPWCPWCRVLLLEDELKVALGAINRALPTRTPAPQARRVPCPENSECDRADVKVCRECGYVDPTLAPRSRDEQGPELHPG